jgi:glycosyltransferase involved in cell wall biosynthesis
MPPPTDISVVIPVHNASTTLGGVIDAFTAIGSPSVELIIVDDGSHDESPSILRAAAEAGRVTALFHDVNRGAGVARNHGFEHAEGRYTLFFDADDQIHPDALSLGVEVLDESAADVAVMAYRYRRAAEVTHDSMNSFDEAVWTDYLGTAPRRIDRLDRMPRLLGFTNYPWNKIIRTSHYRAAGLRFSATPVHNDVLGHWWTLLNARDIAVIDEVICTHEVAAGGAHLTNRQSRDRLAIFDALDDTYDLLESHPSLRARYSHHYWELALRITDWAADRLSDDVRDEFRARLETHLMRINLVDYARIRTRRNPSLAGQILRRAIS